MSSSGTSTDRGASRRRVLIDAALEVVADEGLKGLTHRAVDRRAELPLGSTANVFRSRRALTDAVVDELEHRDAAIFASQTAFEPSTRAELVDLLVGGVQAMTDARGAPSTRVRLHLMIAAPDRLALGHRRLQNLLETRLEDLGVADAPARATAIAALLDGVMLHTLTVAPRSFDASALTESLHRLLEGPG